MADEKFKITIKGTGLNFDQAVDKIAVNQIMSFVLTGSALPNGGQEGGANKQNAPGSGSGSGSSGLTAKQFLAQKKPATLYERVACLGYFLHNEKDTPEFSAKEIRALNKDAAQQPISNLPQRIADTARKYGFIAAAGRNKQMTMRGDAVVLALPDREAVKTALAEHPMGNRRKKNKAKKKK